MNEAVRYINQEFNEKRFNRKHIDGYIRDSIQANVMVQKQIQSGITLVKQYMEKDYYESKNNRISQLNAMDIPAIVVDIFVGIAYIQREELFTSVSAQMAMRLGFSDRVEAIQTVAELLAVLCMTDAFDICKASRSASLVIVSRIPLEDKILRFIEESKYLPPMVCEPNELTSNYSSGYLTHNDSLILGSGNHHDGDICIDVLNIMNKTELSLDLDYLCKVEEQPDMEKLITQDQLNQWKVFKQQSYQMYDLIQSQGNVFHMTHKVDKRGRIYSQGYHINPQGSSFKKAIVNLNKEVFITGVP